MNKTKIKTKCGNCQTDIEIKFYRKTKYDFFACSLHCKGKLQTNHFIKSIEEKENSNIKDLMTSLYVQQQLSFRQIANRLRINQRSVKKLLVISNIEIRKGSEAVKSQWQNNTARRKNIGKVFSQWKKQNPEKAREHGILAMKANLENKGMTSIEKLMANAFQSLGLDFEFEYLVGNKFFCDFAFPESKLIVECDGYYWHSTERRKKLDKSKDAYLNACGFEVVRLAEKDILANAQNLASEIKQRLQT